MLWNSSLNMDDFRRVREASFSGEAEESFPHFTYFKEEPKNTFMSSFSRANTSWVLPDHLSGLYGRYCEFFHLLVSSDCPPCCKNKILCQIFLLSPPRAKKKLVPLAGWSMLKFYICLREEFPRQWSNSSQWATFNSRWVLRRLLRENLLLHRITYEKCNYP